MDNHKLQEFYSIAAQLNQKGITPILYGSLGLEQLLETELHPDDIDILIPEKYLKEKWEEILFLMHQNGYFLYDEHEHAFKRQDIVAFASIENLEEYICLERLLFRKENNCQYYLLSLKDYLKVYQKSTTDGYRQDKKGDKDREKIKLIKEYYW